MEGIYCASIRNAAAGAASGFSSATNAIGRTIYSFGLKVTRKVKPILLALARRLYKIWLAAIPYFVSILKLAKTDLGISCILLGLAIGLVVLTEQVKDPHWRAAFLAVSILSAIGSGMFLLNSGILPTRVTVLPVSTS